MNQYIPCQLNYALLPTSKLFTLPQKFWPWTPYNIARKAYPPQNLFKVLANHSRWGYVALNKMREWQRGIKTIIWNFIKKVKKITIDIVSLQPRLKQEHSHLLLSSLTLPGNCWVVMAHLKQVSNSVQWIGAKAAIDCSRWYPFISYVKLIKTIIDTAS